MAWEKIVTAYDSVDKARNALRVLQNAGYNTSDLSIIDRTSLGNHDTDHVGLWRRLFGENVWEHEAAVYGNTIDRGGAILAARVPHDQVARIMTLLDVRDPMDVHAAAAKIGEFVPVQARAQSTPFEALIEARETAIPLLRVEKPGSHDAINLTNCEPIEVDEETALLLDRLATTDGNVDFPTLVQILGSQSDARSDFARFVEECSLVDLAEAKTILQFIETPLGPEAGLRKMFLEPLDVYSAAAKIGETVPVQAKALVTPPIAKADARDPETLRLAEEQLNVAKRMFQTGTTRIRRFVTERPVEAQVSLHEEHAEVVRRASSDPSYVADIDWSDRVYEVTETAEEAVISKTARVVEEYISRKAGSDRVETVKDTVRRQQVEVDKTDVFRKS